MMAGTALGQTWNDLSMSALPTNGTILQALSEHNISWKNYFGSLPSTLIWPGQGRDVTFFDHLRGIENYFIDAKNGTLPPYSVWGCNALLMLAGVWVLKRVVRY